MSPGSLSRASRSASAFNSSAFSVYSARSVSSRARCSSRNLSPVSTGFSGAFLAVAGAAFLAFTGAVDLLVTLAGDCLPASGFWALGIPGVDPLGKKAATIARRPKRSVSGWTNVPAGPVVPEIARTARTGRLREEPAHLVAVDTGDLDPRGPAGDARGEGHLALADTEGGGYEG